MQQQRVENSVKVDVCGIRRKKSFKSSLSPGSIDNWRNFHWKNVEKFSVKSFAKTHRSVPSPEKTTHSINLSDLLTPHILSSLSYVAAKKPPTRANYNKLFRPLLKKKKILHCVHTTINFFEPTVHVYKRSMENFIWLQTKQSLQFDGFFI